MESLNYADHAPEVLHGVPTLDLESQPFAGDQEAAPDTDDTPVPNTYLSSAKRTVFLSWEEEKALVTRLRAGDVQARQRLIESHLPLVIGIARGYGNKGLPMGDLIQEGNIGLIRGVDRFCPEMGTRLSSYATFWIREGMQRSLIRSRLIRLPDYLAKSLHARKQKNQARAEHPDTADAPAAKADTLDAWSEIQVLSLDAPQSDNSEHTLLDHLEADMEAPESRLDEDRVRNTLKHCMNVLSAKQRQVISLRFGLDDGEPLTLEEVASRVGTSREAVRQLQVRALRCLRQAMEEEGWSGVEG
ncbi:MAG: sigma-70 family RNA polymerase sigma factor [Pseudomonadota bacterium]